MNNEAEEDFVFDFQRYLESKTGLDERSLHPRVFSRFRALWPTMPGARVLELGAGTGTMAERLRRQGFPGLEYHLLDQDATNLARAQDRLKSGDSWSFPVHCDSIENFLGGAPAGAAGSFQDSSRTAPELFDAILAHAVLDLLDLETLLPRIAARGAPGAVFYFSLNFDKWTHWEPVTDHDLDSRVVESYHASMNADGAGRSLFTLLPKAGFRIVDAAASDWIVRPESGSDGKDRYPGDEAYFLECILHFFESSVGARHDLGDADLRRWLSLRRAQVRASQAVFLAHQWDVLAVKKESRR